MKLTGIQVKALFLLFVFSVNIAVGFACSVGLDMGFNSSHHDEQSPAVVEGSHAHKPAHPKSHTHSTAHSDDNDKRVNNDKQPAKNEDNCCDDIVIKFAQLDKSCTSIYSLIHAGFVTVYEISSFNADILTTHKAEVSVKYFVRNYHPPIPDIRTSIHSFQI